MENTGLTESHCDNWNSETYIYLREEGSFLAILTDSSIFSRFSADFWGILENFAVKLNDQKNIPLIFCILNWLLKI